MQQRKIDRMLFAGRFAKYGWDNLVKSVLCIGTDEYCLVLEKQLRPSEHIGWNIGVGGGAAFIGCKHSDEVRKILSDKSKGKPKSLEARKRMSLAKKGTVPTLEARKNMSEAAKLRVFAESHKSNISKAKKGIPNQSAMKWKAAQADLKMWLQACEIYDLYKIKTRRWTSEQLKQFGSPQNLCKMNAHFKRGWNPHADLEYQAWKQGWPHKPTGIRMVRIVKNGTAELMKSVCDLIGYDLPNADSTENLTIEFVDGRICVTQKSTALEPIPTPNED